MLNPALENIVRLFREDKISKYVVEREFYNALEDNLRSEVCIVDSNSLKNTFGITTIPSKKDDYLYTKYIVDKSLFNLPLTDEEIVKMFFDEERMSNKILMMLSKFLIQNNDIEFGVREALAFFAKTFRQSMLNISKPIFDKLKKLNKVVTFTELESLINELEDGSDSLTMVIENIRVSSLMPNELIDEAKKVAKTHFDKINNIDTPELNTIQKSVEGLITSEYRKGSKEVPHDYRPKI